MPLRISTKSPWHVPAQTRTQPPSAGTGKLAVPTRSPGDPPGQDGRGAASSGPAGTPLTNARSRASSARSRKRARDPGGQESGLDDEEAQATRKRSRGRGAVPAKAAEEKKAARKKAKAAEDTGEAGPEQQKGKSSKGGRGRGRGAKKEVVVVVDEDGELEEEGDVVAEHILAADLEAGMMGVGTATGGSLGDRGEAEEERPGTEEGGAEKRPRICDVEFENQLRMAMMVGSSLAALSPALLLPLTSLLPPISSPAPSFLCFHPSFSRSVIFVIACLLCTNCPHK